MNRELSACTVIALIGLSLTAPAEGQLFSEKKSPTERRKEIDDSRSKILEDLFEKDPKLKKKVKEAAGYGTFDALNVNLLVLSTARGSGVVVDNVKKEQTYMKLTSIGGGIGAGLKDLRALIIFNDHKTLLHFVDSGWHFGAQADAVAKSDEKGGEVGESMGVSTPSKDGDFDASMSTGLGEAAQVDTAMEVYKITKAGISAQATIGGVKFSKDKDLN